MRRIFGVILHAQIATLKMCEILLIIWSFYSWRLWQREEMLWETLTIVFKGAMDRGYLSWIAVGTLVGWCPKAKVLLSVHPTHEKWNGDSGKGRLQPSFSMEWWIVSIAISHWLSWAHRCYDIPRQRCCYQLIQQMLDEHQEPYHNYLLDFTVNLT